MKTLWLNMHVGYACRHRGACCSSGWPIPIEHDRAGRVEQAIASGRVRPMVDPWLHPAIGAPDDVAGTLALTGHGACTFFQLRDPVPDAPLPGLCAIHEAKPSSCEHFPYLCLIDARGVRVTLSHYCPTAAEMLVDHAGPLAVVEGPPVLPDAAVPEGLDARDVLPPLESPGRLVDLDAFSRWERDLVRSLGGGESALANRAGFPDRALFDLARAAVPDSLEPWPDAPADLEEAWTEAIAPQWPEIAPFAGRYLAARAFASWVAYQGAGLPAVERSLAVADAVFRIELVSLDTRAGREVQHRRIDRNQILGAIQQSDLLLAHHIDPSAFARSL